ncbi:hypothetical protein [Phaeovulum sp. W22_SRMD_FR3]|uniref:hypothetical protein n=1 Tax=Phaeovulum sp. W22_SRMD_FR3 TaxID=3240274 RepID=UPI003F963FDC
MAEVERDGSETPFIVAAFRLLILTGCRLGEIQTLQWAFLTEAGMELPDTKTGARRIPLPHAARAVLDALPRSADNPYVIEGKLPGRYATVSCCRFRGQQVKLAYRGPRTPSG